MGAHASASSSSSSLVERVSLGLVERLYDAAAAAQLFLQMRVKGER
jgi:hypothetical protein